MGYTSVAADGEVEIRMEAEGPGAWLPTTVMKVLQETVDKYRDRPALRYKESLKGGTALSSEWTTLTWAQYYQEVMTFSKSLISLGFAPHSAINIIGFNSPEWLIADIGSIAAGGMAVGIYTTNSSDACHYITRHSEAQVVVVENKVQLDKYLGVPASTLPSVKALVVWQGEVGPDTSKASSWPVYTWRDFMQLGSGVSDEVINQRIEAQRAGHCCTLIYTSGTTGPPKAVMISNDNMTWTVRAYVEASGVKMGADDRCASYLPLSHQAAQLLDIHIPICVGACCYFCQPDALKGSLATTLKEVRPTYFMGVPRVWEKIYEKMVLEYFASLDLPIMETYGESESSGPHTASFPHSWKIGSIGRDIPGMKSKLAEDTGEMWLYGRNVMMGYMKMPQETAATIDEEGWLHSGDVAQVDEDGFWRITGRIKELIITAGGENIPPVLIEDSFKAEIPALSNAMVVGDKKKFLSILLCLKTDVGPDGLPTGKLTKQLVEMGASLGSQAATVDDVMGCPMWKAYLDQGLKRANARATSNAQKVQKYRILTSDFSEKGGELTPTLKLKRSVVLAKYANVIESLYEE